MDDSDYGEIALFLSSLSRKATLPASVTATPPTEFGSEDVRFDDNSWLARIADTQGWLWLDDALNLEEGEQATAEKLFAQLAPEAELVQFKSHDRVIWPTEAGVETLEARLARADERSARFTEAIDDGIAPIDASDAWARDWEEPESTEPPNIKAKVDTLPIAELVDHAREDELDLNPPYQREYIWSNPDSQKLIESILRGIPLPSIILAKMSGEQKLQIVDGKQRLTSILRFVGAHPSAVAFARDKNDEELFQKDFRKFAKRHAVTTDDIKKHYLPFKTKSYDKKDPLHAVSGKFYDEIREVKVSIAGDLLPVRKLFENNSSPYKVPILQYEETAIRDIHKVFTIYNQQGVKLNAEEIRNAVYNHLEIVQLMLFIGGDRYDPNMAQYAVDAGVDPRLAHDVINEMGFSILRFKRTKVLLWMLAALLHPTGTTGKYKAPSTAGHIDSFLISIDGKLTNPLKTHRVLTHLAQSLVGAIQLHADAGQAWHPKFRTKRDGSPKWEELGAVASLAVCFVLVVLEREQLLLDQAEQLRSVTKEMRGPKSTQNKTQWKHISHSILGILEALGVEPDEARARLEEQYGVAAIEGLSELRNLQIDA